MIKKFLRNEEGNYAVITAIAMLPVFGAVSLAVDFAELTRQKQSLLNAADATCVATAKYFMDGGTPTQTKSYAQDFFKANVGPLKHYANRFEVVLPNETDNPNMVCTAYVDYKPFFRPPFLALLGEKGSGDVVLGGVIQISGQSEVRLQNTVEIALVLDNSGSMEEKSSGTAKTRIEILRAAASELVDQMAKRAELMKRVEKPVQISLVPFSASVNVGSTNADKSWMDTQGRSPVQYENFSLPATIATNKQITWSSGAWRKTGSAWPAGEKDTIFTRFSLYKDLKKKKASSGSQVVDAAAWEGCVESRPYPYNVDDTVPDPSNGSTYFVPMFAPDEHSPARKTASGTTYNAYHDWWVDTVGRLNTSYTDYYQALGSTDVLTGKKTGAMPQRDVTKYYTPAAYGTSFFGKDAGPNMNCATTPILELTDVGTTAGKDLVKTRIQAMNPEGATDVPEGMAWGWRTISSKEPFTTGRNEIENGNDKVVIVLTDGANTYYTPSSLGVANDLADNKSTYSAHGYTGQKNQSSLLGGIFGSTRLFMGMPVGFNQNDHSNANFTTAMNVHFKELCDNAKAGKVIVMTVALDLRTTVTAENNQINLLKECASPSRIRKNPDGTPAKLFWNSTGSSLSEDFKAIGDELSNLRVVG